MAAASRPNLEKATWLGHVQRLRELLDEECSEVQSRFGRDEPENEIPCQKEEANDASDANSNVCSAMSELQSAWKGGEANEVVALIQSALALVGVYEKNASRSACGKANEDVDGLKAAVLGARKSLKDREWSLVEAKHKAQQLEDERLRQDCHIRALQTALDKAVSSRTESEKRHLEAYSTADAEAAEQRGELRRRLSAAEVARDQATAELAAIEQKVEEARKVAQRREEDLADQLSAKEKELEELRQRLKTQEEAREKGCEEAASKATSKMPSFRIQGMPSGGVLEAHMQGVGTVMTTPRQHYEPPSAPRSAPRALRTAARAPSQPTPEQRPPSKASAPMPMDLRSLGKLLSGGGMLGK